MKLETKAVLSQLDLSKVSEIVRAYSLPEWEYESLAERILLAADLWLLSDLQQYDTILVEYEWDNVVKGIYDLVLATKTGFCKVIDWKTTGDVKRSNYAAEIENEFQTTFYLSFGGEDLVQRLGLPAPNMMEYRCIDSKPITRTKAGEEYEVSPGHVLVIRKLNEVQREDALAQVEAIHASYFSQTSLPVWIRNRPRACFKGGSWQDEGPTCPFWRDCVDMTMPPTPDDDQLLYDKLPRSKSSIKDFINCPEQFRRMVILGERESMPKPLYITLGEAFHAGVAEIWLQAYAKKSSGTLQLS